MKTALHLKEYAAQLNRSKALKLAGLASQHVTHFAVIASAAQLTAQTARAERIGICRQVVQPNHMHQQQATASHLSRPTNTANSNVPAARAA